MGFLFYFVFCTFDYMVRDKFKPLFERSLREQSQVLAPHVAEVQTINLRMGLYNSYRNELCISKDLFIHEYPDHKLLVRIDALTGATMTVKVIG
ncbi:hypothetical protein PBAC_29610 [Pedobacter glucosidilyticus]|nr:hypothetical protein PBAC_29610 [Pedobacter glucosidilyticus]